MSVQFLSSNTVLRFIFETASACAFVCPGEAATAELHRRCCLRVQEFKPSVGDLEEKSAFPSSGGLFLDDSCRAPLRGVFYSEFDNTLGPKVVMHAGECPVSEVFDRVSDYVITKPQLVCVQCIWRVRACVLSTVCC